jgi:hypothetical protein
LDHEFAGGFVILLAELVGHVGGAGVLFDEVAGAAEEGVA